MRRALLFLAAIFSLQTVTLLPAPECQAPPPRADFGRATYETDVAAQQAESKARQLAKPQKPVVTEEDIPVVEDTETFPVRKIVLEGCESFPPESFAGLISKYENREIGLNAIQRLGKQIEREYLKRGIIAAVYAPPQDIKEGTLTLKVIEAKMGDLQIAKTMWFNEARLRSYWPIRQGEVLRYDRISKSIQLMNKNPDREVKAALHAGAKPGTTDVALTPETSVPVHASFTYDNDGSPSTGNLRTGFGGRHNNFLNNDDSLMGGYTYGKDFGSVYAYHNLPINYQGASLLYGFSKSQSSPQKDFQPYDMHTWADKIDVSVHQDIYRKDEYLGEVYAEFSAQDKRTFANSGGPVNSGGGTINKDRLRTFSLGGTYVKRGLGSTAVITPQFTQGLGILGASPPGDPYLTRGAPAIFSKWSCQMMTRTALPFDLSQNLKVTSQVASDKLNPSEGLSFGGIDSIRGYPAGDIIVDNGVLMNLEVLSPVFFLPEDWRLPYALQPLKNEFKMLAFCDYGYGERRGESKSHNELGIGAGLRYSFYNQANVRLEWGYPCADHPLSNGRAWFFHFAVSFNDTMPQELERIAKAMEQERAKQAAWALLEGEMWRPDSPIRREAYGYYAEGVAAEREGRLEDAAYWYGRVIALADSLYRQAAAYISDCKAQAEEFKSEHAKAASLYRAGKAAEAEEIWKKIQEQAKPKPFFLETDQMKQAAVKK